MAKIAINIKDGTVDKGASDTIVGIDLGTTNSLIAVVRNGESVVLTDEDGQHALTPSIIYFHPDGHIATGRSAQEGLILHPERTVFSAKRLMGKSYKDLAEYTSRLAYKIREDNEEQLVRVEVDGKFYTPVELSSVILKTLKNKAEKVLNTGLSKAVITVPAYFNDSQRQATRDAGKLAGLDVLRIVNEPTAAALAYGLGLDKDRSERIAVYDLGGGTFDISILRVEDGIFEVVATNGNTFLGGDDIDNAIVDHWMSLYDLPEVNKTKYRLLAERAKVALSHQPSFSAEIQQKRIILDQDVLRELMKPIIEQTIRCCEQALKDAKMSVDDIDNVVLVGGNTKSPLVKEHVASFFGKKPFDDLNPDEVVAKGAALQADILAGNRKDLLLLDITPLSLGIETVGGLMDVIIPRNTSIPFSAAREYTTSIDGQANLKVAIFQGEREMVADNRNLGTFILRNIPPMPAGIPKIQIKFAIDANGILQVSASELRSGVSQEVEVRSQFSLSAEEMAHMLKSSIEYAEKDIQARALQESKVEADQLLLSLDKFKKQHADIVGDKLEAIEALEKELKDVMEKDDKDVIQKVMSQLNDFTKPMAELAMDHSISAAMKGKKI